MAQNLSTRNAVVQPGAALALDGKIPTDFSGIAAPATRVFGLTMWLGVIGFGFFGAAGYYAATAKMQSAVVAGGSFQIEGDLLVVDHLEGGILSEINVREGARVQKGDVLARLDGTRAKAQLGILRNQLASALSRQARLAAAGSGSEGISFPEELETLIAKDPTLAQVKQTQADLFSSNRKTDAGEFQIFSERIKQLQTRERGLAAQERAMRQRLAIVADETGDLRRLFKDGLVNKARLNAREEDGIELETAIARLQNERQDVFEQVGEVEQRQLQIARDRMASIADEQQVLAEIIFDLRQRIHGLKEVEKRLAILAPISGRVVGFEANTIGSVVQPGQVLMEIVPENAPFIIEAQVNPGDIDEVHAGRDARVRLSAYSFRKTPPIEGRVTYVSANSFYDQAANNSYYRIHLEIDPASYENLPDSVTPQTGMPVQVMVATGEQTLLTYLLDPVLGGLESALREGD